MSEKKELAVIEPAPVTPMDLILSAQNKGADIEQMRQLLDLQIRWEENEAKKAYHCAVAAFKSETINIVKDKKVGYTNKDGTFTGYSHATLGNIVQTIIPVMGKHGLSHSWNVEQANGEISVTCRLAHELGHSTSVTMAAGKDDSGKKNAIQQVASTVTYLERYTLLAITGLATADQDDDGKNATKKDNIDYITERQESDLLGLIKEVKADEKGFCTFFQIESVAHLHADKFGKAVAMLEAKRGKS